jgi:hypothetical protein
MAIVNPFDQLKKNPSNLGQINLNALIGDGSKYFNNYFDKTITISTAKEDAVVSYFEKVTDNKESALALASAVVYTSRIQGIDPMLILDEFKKLNRDQLAPFIAQFLNLNRVGTSLIGVQKVPTRSKYVSRTILA